MSSGSLQQLSSRGVQDSHLSVNPETSFFKRTYKRVSNYAIESLDMEISNLAWNQSRTVAISRSGDLLTEVWLVIDIALLELAVPAGDKVFWTNCLGHAALTNISLDIGTSEIDKFDGNWLEILHELTSTTDVDVDELVLRSNSTAQLVDWSLNGNTTDATGDITQLYVKLPFYFTKSRSQALPTIALQYHDIRVKLTLRAASALMVFTDPTNTTLHATRNGAITQGVLMCNFAFLDSLERKLFAANAHEYLITNVQVSNFHTKAASAARVSANVVFSHPVIALYWYVLTETNAAALQYFNWECTPGRGDDTIISATIKFNGSEREKPRGPLYWRAVTASTYFGRTPKKNLYVYSFAQMPNSWTPSGSANLSRIDTTSLDLTFRTTDSNGDAFGAANVSIYALNFNIIRAQAGMAAKKYSS